MKKIIINIIKGVIIGICNFAPGISGSTVSLILGVYQKTIKSISQIDIKLIRLIRKLDFKNIKTHTEWIFLISLGIGVLIGAIICGIGLKEAFKNYKPETEAYFFGVIIAFTIYIIGLVKKWRIQDWIALTIGCFISFSLVFISTGNPNDNLFFIFFCGFIASIGLVTPGLSGSYLVLILGNFEIILTEPISQLTQLNFFNKDILILFIFLVGQGLGVLLFSKPVKWCLEKYHNTTFATLSGLVLGSLIFIWPWKNIHDDNMLLIEKLSFPSLNQTNDFTYILLITIGIISVIVIQKIARKYQNV